MKTRTRFAPSPTGFMHVGNLRTAIFEYITAKHNNGDFILRIEDTDQARIVDGAIQFIYNTLNLCDIKIDEGPSNEGIYGPYIQSERKNIYKEYALKLVEKEFAYYCFCNEDRLNNLRELANKRKEPFMYDGYCKKYSKEEIEKKIKSGEPYVIRQIMPKAGESSFDDVVYGKIRVQNKVLEDQILLKSDGYPTYNFANVVDDHLMDITHVIRGNEYLSQTPKYNLLYEAFGWTPPVYIHLPMVLGEDGNKLSKRNGDASFMDLYQEGYIPEAIVNYLSLLGWAPPDNKEIFTMAELIQNFEPSKISKSPASYDKKKLNWINAHYIKALSQEEYLKWIRPFLEAQYDLKNKSEEWINTLLLTYQNHIAYGKEIVNEVKLFFNENLDVNEESQNILDDEIAQRVLQTFKEEIAKLKEWNILNIGEVINIVKEKTGEKGKMLYMPIRIKISGLMHGPELPNTIFLIGQEEVLKKLK